MKSLPTQNILGVEVAAATMDEVLSFVEAAIDSGRQVMQASVNAGKYALMADDALLAESIHTADLVCADGQSVVWASRLLGRPLPERIAGIDLMQALIARAARKGYRIYLFGARQEVVKAVADKIAREYGTGIIAGYRHGYFNEGKSAGIAREINASGANILFVGISSPAKELFLKNYRHLMPDVAYIQGVGGSFDVMAGRVKRAPLWMQKLGLEWLMRLLQEPGRMWKRYWHGNIRFIRMVAKAWYLQRFQGRHS